ncbi:hypothetical protein ACFRR7_26125 [Streptomyces sp. NPDC056909]
MALALLVADSDFAERAKQACLTVISIALETDRDPNAPLYGPEAWS